MVTCLGAASCNLLDSLEKTVNMPEAVSSLTTFYIYICLVFLVKRKMRARRKIGGTACSRICGC